jgi:hypothetical protein
MARPGLGWEAPLARVQAQVLVRWVTVPEPVALLAVRAAEVPEPAALLAVRAAEGQAAEGQAPAESAAVVPGSAWGLALSED